MAFISPLCFPVHAPPGRYPGEREQSLALRGRLRAPAGAGSELTGRAGLAHRMLEAYVCGKRSKGSNLALLPGGPGTLQVIAVSSSSPGAQRLSIRPCPLAPGRRLSSHHDGAHSDLRHSSEHTGAGRVGAQGGASLPDHAALPGSSSRWRPGASEKEGPSLPVGTSLRPRALSPSPGSGGHRVGKKRLALTFGFRSSLWARLLFPPVPQVGRGFLLPLS